MDMMMDDSPIKEEVDDCAYSMSDEEVMNDEYIPEKKLDIKDNEKQHHSSSMASSTATAMDFIKKRITENTTKEYVEQSYYKQLPKSFTNRVSTSRFWLEFAEYLSHNDIDHPLPNHNAASKEDEANNDNVINNDNQQQRDRFLPRSIELAGKNCSELILALSVIDLPFSKSNAEIIFHLTGGIATVKSDQPFIVYHKDIVEENAIESSPVMIYECFFDYNNRYQTVNRETFELFCAPQHEYLVNQIYGAKVIVTNATDMNQNFQVLYQIPVGAVPLLCSQSTDNHNLSLSAYRSDSFIYYFYFPYSGTFAHFPSHLSKNGSIQTSANPTLFTVTTTPSNIHQSWSSIALFGSDEAVRFSLLLPLTLPLPLQIHTYPSWVGIGIKADQRDGGYSSSKV
jgi:hypothetical protein